MANNRFDFDDEQAVHAQFMYGGLRKTFYGPLKEFFAQYSSYPVKFEELTFLCFDGDAYVN